jgi:hypothetical protein
VDIFRSFALRARLHTQDWYSEHPVQIAKLDALRADTAALLAHLDSVDLTADYPWNRLWLWAENALSVEGQELLASLLMEPYPHLVDGLSSCMAADETATWRIDGAMSTDRLRALTESIYSWALDTDWTTPEAQARVWYTSEEKLEPRLGDRFEEHVEPYEQPLCPGRDAARMYSDLCAASNATVAGFLMRHPEHRHIVRRAQITARLPYAEIRVNTIADTVMPIDMLRLKLSFFGACHFDPRSDRWVRINMYQHAPFPYELGTRSGDDWAYPFLTGGAA